MSEVARALDEKPLRRFKPYPAYKDSGVEWPGEIPANWDVARVGELMTLINGYPFESEHFVRGEGVPLMKPCIGRFLDDERVRAFAAAANRHRTSARRWATKDFA